jgi:hypothetical protein
MKKTTTVLLSVVAFGIDVRDFREIKGPRDGVLWAWSADGLLHAWPADGLLQVNR